MIERHELTVRIEWWHEYRLTTLGLLDTLKSQYPDFEFTVKELAASPCEPLVMRRDSVWVNLNETDLDYVQKCEAIKIIVKNDWKRAKRELPDGVFRTMIDGLKKYGGGIIHCTEEEFNDALRSVA